MSAFPSELNRPDARSIKREQRPNTIRTNMDAGAPKVRQKFSKPIFDVSWTVTLTRDEAQQLESFYVTTTASGSKRFTYEDPVFQNEVEARFTKPPAYSSIGAGTFKVSIAMEILP